MWKRLKTQMTAMARQQQMLFRPVAQGDAVPAEVKEALVQALASLLLEAVKATSGEGGRDDQHEDHA